MEVSFEIKEEIRKWQGDLKKALGLHQVWVSKLDSDDTNGDIKIKIEQIEQNIVHIGLMQRKVLEKLRSDLMIHRARNKSANPELEHRKIATQLREHQKQYRNRKNSLLKPSVLSELQIKTESNNCDKRRLKTYGKNDDRSDRYNRNNGCSYKQAEESVDDTDFFNATENFSLKDPPIVSKNSRSNISDVIKNLKTNIYPDSVELTIKQSPSPKSPHSKSSSPSPVRNLRPSPTPSPTLSLPLPGEQISQESFMRFLGLITPYQKQALEKKRNEKKKRSTTSTNKNEYVYGNFEMNQKRKKNFPYLQQNVGPPQTRSQKMKRQQVKRTVTNISPAATPPTSPPPQWPTSFVLPSGLTIQAVPSPGPRTCCVCRQNDASSLLLNCIKCRIFFHSTCSTSPGSESSSSVSRSPVNSSENRYRRSISVCPECNEEVKEFKYSNWTVTREFSNSNGVDITRIKEKLAEKKVLLEKNRQISAELRKLEMRAENLKENIEASNIEKKQLISNQNNTRKRIKTLIDFVNTFKDPGESIVMPLLDKDSSRSTNETNDAEDLSNGL